MNELRPSYYAIIPSEVRYDKDLNSSAKLLYGEITALCNKEGYCWATNKYFAELYSVSNVTISRWIKSLADKGYIYTKLYHKDGSKKVQQRRIYLSHVMCMKVAPLNKNVKTPLNKNVKGTLNKNVKDNNTSINNTINKEYIYSRIYEHWIKNDIIKHQKLTSNMKKRIDRALKDYSEGEIKQSISNYSTILNSDDYYFTHKWTLDEFCTIGVKDRIQRFLSLDAAKASFKKNEYKKKSTVAKENVKKEGHYGSKSSSTGTKAESKAESLKRQLGLS